MKKLLENPQSTHYAFAKRLTSSIELCSYLLVGVCDNIQKLKILMPGKMLLVNVINDLEDAINNL